MFKWIKKIFMSEQNTQVQNAQVVQTQTIQQQTQPIVRKFELEVYDIDEEHDGKPTYTRHHYEQPIIVEATSPKDLQSKIALYRQCGQLAKVVREIPVQQPPQPIKQQQEPVSTPTNIQLPTPNAVSIQQPIIKQSDCVHETCSTNTTVNIHKSKPRYFKVGDIEVKDDNGKIYQKQWMSLSESEASNIRIINNKNNSIVNMTGKHIEMKKWVLIEQSDDSDELTTLEEQIK